MSRPEWPRDRAIHRCGIESEPYPGPARRGSPHPLRGEDPGVRKQSPAGNPSTAPSGRPHPGCARSSSGLARRRGWTDAGRLRPHRQGTGAPSGRGMARFQPGPTRPIWRTCGSPPFTRLTMAGSAIAAGSRAAPCPGACPAPRHAPLRSTAKGAEALLPSCRPLDNLTGATPSRAVQ